MFERRDDQAAGLRRLLTRDGMRVVAFDGGCRGVGSTTAAIDIGAALAEVGRKVLLIDANGGDNGIVARLGLSPRYDLRDAARRQCSLDEALIHAPCGLAVLSASQGAQGLPALRQLDEQCLLQQFDRLCERFDVALIDNHDRRPSRLLARAVGDVVVVASASASSVMGAYTIVKRDARYNRDARFHILVNDVVAARVAELVSANIRRAASQYLNIEMSDLGWVPRDRCVHEAQTRRQPVTTLFPACDAAGGFGRAAASIASWAELRSQDRRPAFTAPTASGAQTRAAYATI